MVLDFLKNKIKTKIYNIILSSLESDLDLDNNDKIFLCNTNKTFLKVKTQDKLK